MDGIQRINQALRFIEDHITDDLLTIEDISHLSGYSASHFQRMFFILTGFTIAEYIRNRRLTLAALEILSNPTIKIIDIALMYGYETPESFTKAFYKLHGVNPSKIKKESVNLVAYNPLSVQLIIKGAVPMNYRIEKKNPITLFGIKLETTTIGGENLKVIPEFWQSKKVRNQFQFETRSDSSSYGICTNFKPTNDIDGMVFDYYVAVGTEETGLDKITIPSLTWVVFHSVRMDEIQNTWKRIYSEWFPSNSYERDAVDFEVEFYPDGYPDDPNYSMEIWIPIKEK